MNQGNRLALPIRTGDLSIRACERSDWDSLALWPPYPFPYDGFRFTFQDMTPDQRDQLFQTRREDPSRISLIVDHAQEPIIGFFALVEIDWAAGRVGNMGIRVKPDWCGRCVGTLALQAIVRGCFACGLKRLRLDVAASNQRAVRCYEKAGFTRAVEFWRNDERLSGRDLSGPQFDFVRPHLRQNENIAQTRFWWMEISR